MLGEGFQLFSSSSKNVTPPASPDITHQLSSTSSVAQTEAFVSERRNNFPTTENLRRKREARAAGLINDQPIKLKCHKNHGSQSSSLLFSAIQAPPLLERLLQNDVNKEHRAVLAALNYLLVTILNDLIKPPYFSLTYHLKQNTDVLNYKSQNKTK
ncbi:hypothetical protein GEMRC1_008448 [Eukaryota sp. GEM-RC1]